MSKDIVIDRCKKIESALVYLGAEGRGLHSKLSSLDLSIDDRIKKKIRFVATIRNKALHDANFDVNSEVMREYTQACDEIDEYLSMMQSRKPVYDRTENEGSESTVGEVKAEHVVIGLGVAAFVTYRAYEVIKDVWDVWRSR